MKLALIPNWRRVIATAHSMWSFYLSVVCLIAPDLIYWIWSIDTPPRLWWLLALGLLVYGILGRVWDQGIDHDKTNSPWFVGALVLAIGVYAVVSGDWRERTPPVAAQGNSTTQATVEALATNDARMPVADDVFSQAAIPFVGRLEGLRLEAYQDVVGVWTVCYGETKGVKPGDQYTRAQCEAMLAAEILEYRAGLHRYFAADTLGQRLPVWRDVAFASLAYNAGVPAIGKSTATRRLNAGNVAGACEAMTWWNKAGGRVIRGLVNRRTEERALCLRGLV